MESVCCFSGIQRMWCWGAGILRSAMGWTAEHISFNNDYDNTGTYDHNKALNNDNGTTNDNRATFNDDYHRESDNNYDDGTSVEYNDYHNEFKL